MSCSGTQQTPRGNDGGDWIAKGTRLWFCTGLYRIPEPEGPLSSESRCPNTEIGDVIVHHAAPKVWVAASVTQSGDLVGATTQVAKTSRGAALAVARELLSPGGRIYVHHQDDAEWEHVR